MTNNLVQKESADVSVQSQKILRVLSNAFSADMALFRKGHVGWEVVYRFGESTSIINVEGTSITNSLGDGNGYNNLSHFPPGELERMLDDLFTVSNGEPGISRIFPFENNYCFIATSSQGESNEFEVIGGVVRLDGPKLAERLLESSVNSIQIDELKELHSQYAARLSSSFEELCFLRRLSSHIEYCVGNRSLLDVAQLVLGELRRIISVESLSLIEAIPEPNSARPRGSKFLTTDGNLPVNEEFWMDVLDGMSHQSNRTQVRNIENSLYQNGFRATSTVRSYAITPIRKENQLFGWLLAVNKKVPHELSGVLLNSLGDNELGSMEASLLEVAARLLGAQAANHEMFKSLEQLIVDVIGTLVNVVEAKDQYTSGHSNRVARIAQRLAEQLQLSPEECVDIYTAGLLHDIGKIGVRDEVLNKPGKLTDAEFEEIKQHPEIGARMLKKMKQLEKYLPGVLYHHEAIDGSGYPCGLKGNQIPLMARVLAVADALDAMTSHRPYRQGMPIEKASKILQAGVGRQWDSEIVAAYFAAKESIDPLCNTWSSTSSENTSNAMQSHSLDCLIPTSLIVLPDSSLISST